MRSKFRIIALVLFLLSLPLAATACGKSKADVAAHNLSVEAEQFKVARRIVAINGITDKYLLEITGYCSIETSGSGLAGAAAVTCKVGNDKQGNPQYKKSYVYLSDNVTFVVQQIDPLSVSAAHYTLLFRPGTIVPDIDANP